VNRARRTVGCWLLAAFLERGCDPSTARLPEPARRERPLTPAELRTFRGPPARVHFLARPGRRGGAIGVAAIDGARRAPAAGAPAGAPTARLLAFPAR
jgi:hypothetical protein